MLSELVAKKKKKKKNAVKRNKGVGKKNENRIDA